MPKLGVFLNLAAIACVVWGDLSGYQAHERGRTLAHSQMRARFEQCANRVRVANPLEKNRLHLLELECSEYLDDDRWMPVLAPNLSRDTAVAGAGPMGLALALVLLGLWAPRRLGAPRASKPKPVAR